MSCAGVYKRLKLKKMKNIIIFTLTAFFIITFAVLLHAADEENCLMCHKYSGMGRFESGPDGKGKKRVFFVNEDIFKNTVHGNLRCKNCHTDVDKLPHTGVKKVNCAQNCHIKDPSSGREFSHKRIVDTLEKSIHGVKGTKHPEYKDDLPTCTYCHKNPVYITSAEGLKFLNICGQCHEKQNWAKRFIKHQYYRMIKRRPSKEVVTLCSSCHQDSSKMARHKLDIAIGFRDTFHGKAIEYGNEDVANCLNCHAPRGIGLTPHSIVSKTDPLSSVNAANRQKTCQNYGGTGGCHPGATKEFALGRQKIHASGAKNTEEFLKAAVYDVSLTKGGKKQSGNKKVNNPDESFRENVVFWINTIYKIAIAVVIGGMIIHQMLDFIAVARERRRNSHGLL